MAMVSLSPVMQTLSSNLRAERARRCWTAQDLADRAGLSAFTVYEIEQQKGNPSLLTLTKIAGAFGLSVLELLAATSVGAQGDSNESGSIRPNSPTPASDPSVALSDEAADGGVTTDRTRANEN